MENTKRTMGWSNGLGDIAPPSWERGFGLWESTLREGARGDIANSDGGRGILAALFTVPFPGVFVVMMLFQLGCKVMSEWKQV